MAEFRCIIDNSMLTMHVKLCTVASIRSKPQIHKTSENLNTNWDGKNSGPGFKAYIHVHSLDFKPALKGEPMLESERVLCNVLVLSS